MSTVIIVFIVFAFTAFIVKMGLDHDREKRSLKSSGDNSLTSSELRSLIRDAVDDANRDLADRLDVLERRLAAAPDRRRLPTGDADQDDVREHLPKSNTDAS